MSALLILKTLSPLLAIFGDVMVHTVSYVSVLGFDLGLYLGIHKDIVVVLTICPRSRSWCEQGWK